MNTDLYGIQNIVLDLINKLSKYREEKRPTAGTKYRLLGLEADIWEVMNILKEGLQQHVDTWAYLNDDEDIDFLELSNQISSLELDENDDLEEDIYKKTMFVNDNLGFLEGLLKDCDEKMRHRPSDENCERIYEREKLYFMRSEFGIKIRNTFKDWMLDVCNGHPQLDNLEDYRIEKLLKMFDKGVLSSRVEHIHRIRHYNAEIDFFQIDAGHDLKTVLKQYTALRQLVDFRDGCLIVDSVRVGRHFYVYRHEMNAKANRLEFLKYMYKIELAQEEYCRLVAAQAEAEGGNTLPDMLATEQAMIYWEKLRKQSFVDDHYQLLENTTRQQTAYIAELFAEKLKIRSKWKPFEVFWDVNNLAQEKNKRIETGKLPSRSNEIDKIFDD